MLDFHEEFGQRVFGYSYVNHSEHCEQMNRNICEECPQEGGIFQSAVKVTSTVRKSSHPNIYFGYDNASHIFKRKNTCLINIYCKIQNDRKISLVHVSCGFPVI